MTLALDQAGQPEGKPVLLLNRPLELLAVAMPKVAYEQENGPLAVNVLMRGAVMGDRQDRRRQNSSGGAPKLDSGLEVASPGSDGDPNAQWALDAAWPPRVVFTGRENIRIAHAGKGGGWEVLTKSEAPSLPHIEKVVHSWLVGTDRKLGFRYLELP